MKIQYYECACGSSEHVLRFVIDEDVEDPGMYMEVQLRQHRNWFHRIWVAVKYVFGYECKYGHWDCWLLDPRDTAGMIDLFQQHQKRCEGKTLSTFIGNPRNECKD